MKRYSALDLDKRYSPVYMLEKADGYDNLIIPPVNTFGIRAISGVTDEKSFIDLMQTITCIPKNAQGGQAHGFDTCPESVVTQGFGDIGATSNLAMALLSRLGISAKPTALEFSEEGARLLLEYYGIDVKREKSAPVGVSYINAAGERKTFVVPFMRDISELSGLVYRPADSGKVSGAPDSRSVSVSVTAVFEPTSDGSARGSAEDAGSALGGGGGKKSTELRMLQKNLRLDTLSRDAVDIAFARVPTMGKTSYGVVLTTPDDVTVGEKALEHFVRVTAIRVDIGSLDGLYSHTIDLDEGQKPEQFLITLGINLPDLPNQAADALDKAFRSAHAVAKKPEPLTVARWRNRNVLYRLIAGQTSFDTEMSPTDKLLLGRIRRPRCLAVVSELGCNGKLSTRIDLLQPFNEIHAGDDGLRKAYFLLNGFFQSSLESRVLIGENRTGYLDIWANAPKDAELHALPVGSGRDASLREMTKDGTYPPRFLQAVKENNKVLFFPSKPTTMSGRKRFAWLEIDPNTFEALSVLDNGCHGGTAESSMLTTSLGEDTREFVKGTWIGINMAVWSVGSIALKTENKGQIFTEAKALALKIGGILAEFQNNLGKAKEYYDKYNELKEQAADLMEKVDSGELGKGDGNDDSDDTDYAGKSKGALNEFIDKLPPVKIIGIDVNNTLKEGFRGFSNGYTMAVDAYFHFFSGTNKHIQAGNGGAQ
ncbi:MAG: hypothetical protein BWY66_00436 [bacterium ADurb.Bin374]|nr:MAG: hypothetical protein BWY66_00436 [bacterium ADurb.Bin374]